MDSYPFSEIEPKWQKFWDDNKTFQTFENDNFPPEKRCYVLDMFPYPSGSGLHVGHPEGYTATDIYCRYLRMNGYNVLHPMGFDSFGLPAENYAITTGRHPRKTTEENISQFIRQIRSLGFSYDWDRMVQTHTPEYYRWTQWIFLQLYKKGLAYEAKLPINWCSSCKTGLANEEVKDGLCERCGNVVQRRNVRQWMLKITDYAEELLAGLQDMDWPESIKSMQHNWIGRSEGTNISFRLAGDASGHGEVEVYSTRPDTLFGATYLVLAPEHPLVNKIYTPSQKTHVEKYVTAASHKSDLERTDMAKTKSGVFTGANAVNPVNQKEIPIWISDYILISYGTGAIMAVPGHDQRDWDFAETFNLPILEVLKGGNISKEAFTGDGVHINSDFLDGLDKTDAIKTVNTHLEANGQGKRTINFKLRDWIFSRQRYWGEPIPLIHCSACGIVPLEEKDLPLLLPEVESYKPTGEAESPLASVEDWVNTPCPKCGRMGRRETNTMPQWAGSCWYYLRYLDPYNTEHLVNKNAEKYWMPVDLYIGGAEHAVLHLLYARFWHRVLHDLGIVSHPEPFQRLVNQGMITSFAYLNANKSYVPTDKVKEKEKSGVYINTETGEEVKQVTAKMSKSLKNVVNPDDIIQQYGADSMRIYEMFMGPLEISMPWQTTGLIGVHRFLNRVWNIAKRPLNNGEPSKELVKELHKTIKKADRDTKSLNFNTAISQMMILINFLYKEPYCWRKIWEPFVLILSPYAPHLGEEMWEMLGHNKSLAYNIYPKYHPELVREEESEIVVQINGKLRAKITVQTGTGKEELVRLASGNSRIHERISEKSIIKTIVIIDKIVNFVVR